MSDNETRTQVEGLLRSTYEDGTPIPDAMGKLHNLGLTHDRLWIEEAVEALHRRDGVIGGTLDADDWLDGRCARGRNCDSCVTEVVERFERDFSECVDRLCVPDDKFLEHTGQALRIVLGEAS